MGKDNSAVGSLDKEYEILIEEAAKKEEAEKKKAAEEEKKEKAKEAEKEALNKSNISDGSGLFRVQTKETFTYENFKERFASDPKELPFVAMASKIITGENPYGCRKFAATNDQGSHLEVIEESKNGKYQYNIDQKTDEFTLYKVRIPMVDKHGKHTETFQEFLLNGLGERLSDIVHTDKNGEVVNYKEVYASFRTQLDMDWFDKLQKAEEVEKNQKLEVKKSEAVVAIGSVSNPIITLNALEVGGSARNFNDSNLPNSLGRNSNDISNINNNGSRSNSVNPYNGIFGVTRRYSSKSKGSEQNLYNSSGNSSNNKDRSSTSHNNITGQDGNLANIDFLKFSSENNNNNQLFNQSNDSSSTSLKGHKNSIISNEKEFKTFADKGTQVNFDGVQQTNLISIDPLLERLTIRYDEFRVSELTKEDFKNLADIKLKKKESLNSNESNEFNDEEQKIRKEIDAKIRKFSSDKTKQNKLEEDLKSGSKESLELLQKRVPDERKLEKMAILAKALNEFGTHTFVSLSQNLSDNPKKIENFNKKMSDFEKKLLSSETNKINLENEYNSIFSDEIEIAEIFVAKKLAALEDGFTEKNLTEEEHDSFNNVQRIAIAQQLFALHDPFIPLVSPNKIVDLEVIKDASEADEFDSVNKLIKKYEDNIKNELTETSKKSADEYLKIEHQILKEKSTAGRLHNNDDPSIEELIIVQATEKKIKDPEQQKEYIFNKDFTIEKKDDFQRYIKFRKQLDNVLVNEVKKSEDLWNDSIDKIKKQATLKTKVDALRNFKTARDKLSNNLRTLIKSGANINQKEIEDIFTKSKQEPNNINKKLQDALKFTKFPDVIEGNKAELGPYDNFNRNNDLFDITKVHIDLEKKQFVISALKKENKISLKPGKAEDFQQTIELIAKLNKIIDTYTDLRPDQKGEFEAASKFLLDDLKQIAMLNEQPDHNKEIAIKNFIKAKVANTKNNIEIPAKDELNNFFKDNFTENISKMKAPEQLNAEIDSLFEFKTKINELSEKLKLNLDLAEKDSNTIKKLIEQRTINTNIFKEETNKIKETNFKELPPEVKRKFYIMRDYEIFKFDIKNSDKQDFVNIAQQQSGKTGKKVGKVKVPNDLSLNFIHIPLLKTIVVPDISPAKSKGALLFNKDIGV